jgi:hypothetical protein
MAYQFTTNQTLVISAGAAITTPHTIFCKCLVVSTGADTRFVRLNASNSAANFTQNNNFSQAQAASRTSIGQFRNVALSSPTFPSNVFENLFGVFEATNARRVVFNLSASALNTESTDTSSFNGSIELAGLGPTRRIAEVSIWTAVLTAEERASLVKGFKPFRVRPQSLVLYAPALRDAIELMQGRSISANTRNPVDHPRVY